MSKNIQYRVFIDVTMFITMTISFITGIVLLLVYPSGQGSGRIVFLNMVKHTWADIHIYLSLGFMIALLVHWVLNLKLFTTMVKSIMNRVTEM